MMVFKSRKMRWTGHVTRMMKNSSCRIFVGKPEGKISLANIGVIGE
jgi:hypothetical protein